MITRSMSSPNKDFDNELQLLTVLLAESPQPFIAWSPNEVAIIAANYAFYQLTGYIEGDTELKEWLKQIAPKQTPAYGEQFSVRQRTKLERKDKSQLSLEFALHGKWDTLQQVLYYYAFITDISELCLTEEAVRESEERFYKVFHTNPHMMALACLREARYMDVNEEFARFIGCPRDEIIGKTALELGVWHNPADREKVVVSLAQGSRVRNQEFQFQTQSGEARIALLSAEVLSINEQEYMLSALTDITELNKWHNELAYMERLHLIAEMAASIGHEVRNPMTTVRGFLQMLGSKTDLAGYNSYFMLMIEELDRANQIISEFLSLAKNKIVHAQSMDMNEIIRMIFPLLQADALRRGNDVCLDLGHVEKAPLDEKEVRQCILNLVRNGLEAMPGGGQVKIKTFMEANEVVLAIQDKGGGIPSEVLDQLGTPFCTTKESGTGLGLAVCFQIVARHNAKINVDTDSEGTTFYVRFPIAGV